ncbi:deleted in malignant brain tumors 1 protein-like [Melospiza georgiana]|uniref:deleted in malignant brain tumors 1 protein-like n=1 Tax=Melospiza georgiana TaxID=44398 RepID=UPI0025AD6F30|nr:deleted in malignant brain tumors 1 protein-like [Melospiza georgiana]
MEAKELKDWGTEKTGPTSRHSLATCRFWWSHNNYRVYDEKRQFVTAHSHIGSRAIISGSVPIIADEIHLRLSGGPNGCAGNVEIYYFGLWEKVCGYLWDMQDAQVVCRQLGCGFPEAIMYPFPPSDSHSFEVFTEMNCTGSEEFLWYCPYKYQYDGCYHHGAASVICSDSGMTVPPTTVPIIADEIHLRLSGGPNECAGNVEIYYFGLWEKVCGYLWDMQDAQVVCRQLGCGFPEAIMYPFPPSDSHSSEVFTEMNCTGSEEFLWYCPYKYQYDGCYHHGAASVICSDSGMTVPPTTVIVEEIHLRLSGGPNECAGNVEIYSFGFGEKVCGYLWDMQDAQVVCRQLGCGFPVAIMYPFPPSDSHSSYLFTEMNCTGSEELLWYCPYKYQYGACYLGAASVICSDSGMTVPPTTGNMPCSGILYGLSGTFESPGYPNSYPNNAYCVWIIRPWDTARRIQLQFTDVELEGSSCSYDAIEVFDGGSPQSRLLGRVCRNDHRVFNSSGNQLTVLFRSDGSVTKRGFQAYYSSFVAFSTTMAPNTSTASPTPGNVSCGGLLQGLSGTFESPGYPNSYPNNAYCVWIIRPWDTARRIQLQFTDVELEGSSCSYDAIEVFDGGSPQSRLLGHVCRNDHRVFNSSGNQLTVLFRSDSSVSKRGFQAYYSSFVAFSTTMAPNTSTASPTPGNVSCGGLLQGLSGTLQSPGYPNSYPNNAYCVWIIRPWDTARRIQLQFTDVELEGSSCSYDAIEVFDGGSPQSRLLGRVCRNDHRVFNSSGNQLTVLFRSDISITKRGFHAYYSSFVAFSTTMAPNTSTASPTPGNVSCGGLLQGLSGTLQSPGYPNSYPNNAYCVWIIRPWDTARRIQLQFTDVELEGSSCSYDAIEVFDGGSPQSRLLGRVCRNDHRVFNSSGNQLTVLFRSDISITKRGFQAYYSSFVAFSTTMAPNTSTASPTPEDYSCGGLLSSSSGTLQSPFYPRNYPNNADCVWEIEVESNFRVTLTFTDIQMEGGRCLSDYVEIYDGPLHSSPLLGKICSGYYPTYTSSSNLLSVRFHSNSRYTYRGFQANYHSTRADDSTTLLCLPDYMHVVVSRYFLQSHGYSAWNLTLNDPLCTPNITSNSVSFDIPYTRCGTVREGNNDTISYSNTIRGSSSGTLITRNRNLLLHVNCKMLQNTWAKTMYVADDNFEVNETQYERYDVNLTFYDSSSFSRPVYDSPYRVAINQNLFLQASLHSSDPSLELFLDTCVASPTRHNFTTKSYAIIENGCAKDPTYATYYSPFRHTLRFKFNAFQFIQSNPEVYLQCELVVCRAYDYSSRCYQGCLRRSKREASSDKESVIVVAGPIQLWKPEIMDELGSE